MRLGGLHRAISEDWEKNKGTKRRGYARRKARHAVVWLLERLGWDEDNPGVKREKS